MNKYDFYLKASPRKLMNNKWKVLPYSDEQAMYITFPIYKYKDGKSLIYCRMIWYGSEEPLRISVYNDDGNYYSTFIREKYDSSKYMQSLHINILKQINKFTVKAKKKGI